MNETEFEALRRTIAARGTIRIVIVPLTILGWAGLAVVLVLFSELPVTAVLTLAVLAGGFEAVHALHVGAERIGRYLQAFYEERGNGARWETTAMAAGPALPGGGVDPLFSVLFLCATIVNLVPAMLPGPTVLEIGVIGALHLLFVVRLAQARLAAARQREAELERFRALRDQAVGDGREAVGDGR